MTEARALTFVVGEGRLVLESNVPDVVVGEVISASSWVGEASLEAIAAASRTGERETRVGRDYTRGTHWLVEATVSTSPWRAQIVVIDATAAVLADRHAVLAKLVHAMQNISFAVRSVLEAIESDQPTGHELDEYLSYLREPADRLSATMTRVAACLVAPQPIFRPLTIHALIEHVQSRLTSASKPKSVAMIADAMTISGDVEMLSETLVAMLESGGEGSSPILEIDRVDIDGAPFVRVVVERAKAVSDERGVSGLWDLAAGHHLDLPLRLSLARAVVVAHHGDVLAEDGASGRVRLGMRLPLSA